LRWRYRREEKTRNAVITPLRRRWQVSAMSVLTSSRIIAVAVVAVQIELCDIAGKTRILFRAESCSSRRADSDEK
jgi:hypothetical protein